MAAIHNGTQIIKRLSDKTLSMKADQLKLFNRLNNELNIVLSKTQEVIRICLSDRNGKSRLDHNKITSILERFNFYFIKT